MLYGKMKKESSFNSTSPNTYEVRLTRIETRFYKYIVTASSQEYAEEIASMASVTDADLVPRKIYNNKDVEVISVKRVVII